MGEDAFIGCSSCRVIRRTSPSPYNLPFLHVLGFVTLASDKEVHFGRCWYRVLSVRPPSCYPPASPNPSSL